MRIRSSQAWRYGVPVTALFSEPDFGGETPGAPWAPDLARAMVDFGIGGGTLFHWAEVW